jgi:hypothetical protein
MKKKYYSNKAPSSTITTTIMTTTTAVQSSLQCYDCSGPDCGKEGSTVTTNCPTCMLYRNPDEQSKKLDKYISY